MAEHGRNNRVGGGGLGHIPATFRPKILAIILFSLKQKVKMANKLKNA